MKCNFIVEQMIDGRYQHTCVNCSKKIITKAKTLQAICNGNSQFITLSEPIKPCCGKQNNQPRLISRDRTKEQKRRMTSAAERITKNNISDIIIWIRAGRPIRSEEEINNIFYQYCSKCKNYNNGNCTLCGSKIYLRNQLRMTTTDKHKIFIRFTT